MTAGDTLTALIWTPGARDSSAFNIGLHQYLLGLSQSLRLGQGSIAITLFSDTVTLFSNLSRAVVLPFFPLGYVEDDVGSMGGIDVSHIQHGQVLFRPGLLALETPFVQLVFDLAGIYVEAVFLEVVLHLSASTVFVQVHLADHSLLLLPVLLGRMFGHYAEKTHHLGSVWDFPFPTPEVRRLEMGCKPKRRADAGDQVVQA